MSQSQYLFQGVLKKVNLRNEAVAGEENRVRRQALVDVGDAVVCALMGITSKEGEIDDVEEKRENRSSHFLER